MTNATEPHAEVMSKAAALNHLNGAKLVVLDGLRELEEMVQSEFRETPEKIATALHLIAAKRENIESKFNDILKEHGLSDTEQS